MISSAGDRASIDASMPSAARIWSVISMDFNVRGKTPPPAEIREVS